MGLTNIFKLLSNVAVEFGPTIPFMFSHNSSFRGKVYVGFFR